MVVARVKLFATLRRHCSKSSLGKAVEVELPTGSTIADLRERFRIPSNEVKLRFVNGVQQNRAYLIQGGDELGLFPLATGGSGPL